MFPSSTFYFLFTNRLTLFFVFLSCRTLLITFILPFIFHWKCLSSLSNCHHFPENGIFNFHFQLYSCHNLSLSFSSLIVFSPCPMVLFAKCEPLYDVVTVGCLLGRFDPPTGWKEILGIGGSKSPMIGRGKRTESVN